MILIASELNSKIIFHVALEEANLSTYRLEFKDDFNRIVSGEIPLKKTNNYC